MPKVKGPKFKINVTGMTEDQHKFVKELADKRGSNKADVVKGLITDAMEKDK
jgi:hypothetical protein